MAAKCAKTISIGDNYLLSHVVQQRFQSLLDSFLVVECASQQMTFELLVEEYNGGAAATEAD